MKAMIGLAVLVFAALAGCDQREELEYQSASEWWRDTANVVPEPSAVNPAPVPEFDPKPDFLPAAAERPARPAGGIRVQPNRFVELDLEGRSHPVRYKMGKMNVVVKTIRDPDFKGELLSEISIKVPGLPVSVLRANLPSYSRPFNIGWGRLDRAGTPFLLVKSYSGGVHCCTSVQAAVLRPGRLDIVGLGVWDMDVLEDFPSDYDGDGLVDFIMRDNAFLYAFTTHAGSNMPPLVLNVEGSQAQEVSERPGFRPLFTEATRVARKGCLHPEHSPNGACAAYVASAARIGKFDTAWREMLASYDRESDWPLPKGCGLPLGRPACTPMDPPSDYDYPKALRVFLEAGGYLPKRKPVRVG